jgi:hypothetical protein
LPGLRARFRGFILLLLLLQLLLLSGRMTLAQQKSYAVSVVPCDGRCLTLFDSLDVSIRYSVRASMFMNPLLELQLTNSLGSDVLVQLPQGDFVILDGQSLTCDLIVAGLALPVDEAVPGEQRPQYRFLTQGEGIKLASDAKAIVFANAFCTHANFVDQAESDGGLPFPSTDTVYVWPVDASTAPNATSGTGGENTIPSNERPALVQKASLRYSVALNRYKEIFNRLAAGSCVAPVEQTLASIPVTPEPQERANRCAAMLEPDNAATSEPASPEDSPVDIPVRTLTWSSLAAQIAVFIAWDLPPTNDAGTAAALSNVWQKYAENFRNSVYLRDYTGIYCLLNLATSEVHAALALPSSLPGEPSISAETSLIYTPLDRSQGDITHYQLTIVRLGGVHANEIVSETELRFQPPSFVAVPLSTPGDYAVCYQVIGTVYTEVDGKIRLRRPSSNAYRLRVTEPLMTQTAPSPLAGVRVLSQSIPLPELSFVTFLPRTVELGQVALCVIGVLVVGGVVVANLPVRSRLSAASRARRKLRRALIVVILLVLLAFLVWSTWFRM